MSTRIKTVQHSINSLRGALKKLSGSCNGLRSSLSGPGVIHTFVVICHPCFVTYHPFSSTSPAPILDSLTFFFDRTGCVYPPKVDAYTFFNVLNRRSLLSHITLDFQTKLDVILKLWFLYKHYLRSFISVGCLIWCN